MINKISLLLLLSLGLMHEAIGQEQPQDSLYRLQIVDKSPEPIGGMEAVYKWLSQQKNEVIFDRLDTIDCSAKWGGKVFVQYIVETNGQLSNIEVVYGLGGPYDAHCIKLMEQLPIKWKAGMKDGKAVRVKQSIPFNFCE